ncbi:DEBR0S2_14180g1_1 [Brettanomyces bruxellensis]|uniref:DEBR0S2_14180g1_1 n=1 Tax=Dekkera bruxellensis TaxID=5007 RepID=A0A7D9CXZ9_DEKBR|nr:DEBR0S2_14180g1_1 [Brettanomyces bruxellensis]
MIMGGFFGLQYKDLEVSFNFESSPYRCFGPFYPDVTGSLNVRVMKDVHNVTGIKYGFKGTVDGYFFEATEVSAGDFLNTQTTQRHTITDTYKLFEQQQDLNADPGAQNAVIGGLVKKGTVMNQSFHYHFPFETTYLPSSCSNIGGTGDNQASIAVVYSVYVQIQYQGPNGSSYQQLEWPSLLAYQGAPETKIDGPIGMKNYVISNKFKSKVKDFVYDRSKKMLVPSPIQKSHRYTKRILGLWNENYRKGVYDQLAQDVEISCVFSVPNAINILGPFTNAVGLKFRVDTDGELGTDFAFNGQSTGLGKFNVNELKLSDFYQVDMNVCGKAYTTQNMQPLMALRFKEGSLSFDVKDFQFNKEAGVYEINLSLSDFQRATTSPMLCYFAQPAMVYGRVGNIFLCRSSAVFDMTLSNACKHDKKSKVFTARSESIFYLRDGGAPPPYKK